MLVLSPAKIGTSPWRYYTEGATVSLLVLVILASGRLGWLALGALGATAMAAFVVPLTTHRLLLESPLSMRTVTGPRSPTALLVLAQAYRDHGQDGLVRGRWHGT